MSHRLTADRLLLPTGLVVLGSALALVRPARGRGAASVLGSLVAFAGSAMLAGELYAALRPPVLSDDEVHDLLEAEIQRTFVPGEAGTDSDVIHLSNP